MSAKRRVAKSLKNINFKIEETITVNGMEIPITNRSIKETTKIMASIEKIKVPKKTRYATAEEVEDIKKNDPTFKVGSLPMVTCYDKTHEKYQEQLLLANSSARVLEIAGQFIDMDCETETGTVWSDWGLQPNDWIGVTQYLLGNFTQKDIESMDIAIKGKLGQSSYVLLAKLEELSGKSAIEVLRIINKMDSMEKLEAELKEKAISLQELEESVYRLVEDIQTMENYDYEDDDDDLSEIEGELISDDELLASIEEESTEDIDEDVEVETEDKLKVIVVE